VERKTLTLSNNQSINHPKPVYATEQK